MPDPNAQKVSVQPAKSLEALVLAKNKRVLDELTKLRVRKFLSSGFISPLTYWVPDCTCGLGVSAAGNKGGTIT